ncbi:TPA: hypothetical protein PBY09_002902, partial [Staphylococcus aureus]|nr:hypothetical protein [Staphylococcus aureus]
LSRGKKFFETGFSDGFVRFHPNTNKCLTSSFIPIDIPFIVDIEKEVTKDTVFDKLFEVYEFQEGDYTAISHANISINKRLDEHCFPIKAFYILNDDLTMTLIWKDGELVE